MHHASTHSEPVREFKSSGNKEMLMNAFDDYPEFTPQNLDHSISDTPGYLDLKEFKHFKGNNILPIEFEAPTLRNINLQEQSQSFVTKPDITAKSPLANSQDENQHMISRPDAGNSRYSLVKRLMGTQRKGVQFDEPEVISSPKPLVKTNSIMDVSKTKPKQKARRTQSIMVYYHIKRFLTKISAKRRQKLFFKAKHFTLVGDRASEINDSLSELQSYSNGIFKIKQFKFLLKLYRSFMNRMEEAVHLMLKPVPLIYPQSPTKIVWDCILGLVLIYFFVTIPLEITFDNNLLFGMNGQCTISFVVFLILDFLMKMNTIYYEFGQPVTDRAQIFSRYLLNGFMIDALSICSLISALINYYSFQSQAFNLVLFLFFSQGHYFRKIMKDSEESLNLSKETYSVLQLLKLILTLIYVEHIFSCLWYYIAQEELKLGQLNWMSANGIENEEWYVKYLNSFYFSTVTMLSVGYGDIVPTSPLEKIVSVLFMMFACIQLSYSVNTVGDLINQLQTLSDESRRRLRIINNYMNNKKISFGLQYQIREYLKIYWTQEFSEISGDEDRIIGMLSENLKNKLIREANEAILTQCPLFKAHFSVESKAKILKVMKTIVVNPEHAITSTLPLFGEPCLCYIETGYLDVFIRQSGGNEGDGLTTYLQGHYFGMEEFITGHSNTIKMISQQFVKLIVLQRSEFLKIIAENPLDYEEFCMIKDQYQLKSKVVEIVDNVAR